MVSRCFIVSCVFVSLVAPVEARTRLKNICRVKGQEGIVLRGQGLVVGLNGTGEANDPITMEFIARAIDQRHKASRSRGCRNCGRSKT
jgi:flagellar basal body P-ring protein FlgI